jgi:hypothetical protein
LEQWGEELLALVIFMGNTCNIEKGRRGRKKKGKKKVGCGNGDKNVELHGTIIIGFKLIQPPPPPPNCQVQQVGRFNRSKGNLG